MIVYITKVGYIMKYNWSNDDIKNDIKLLKEMLDKEESLTKKAKYLEIIDLVNNLLYDEVLSKLNIKTLNSNIMFDMCSSINSNNRYYLLNNLFYNESKDYLDKINYDCNINYNYINITNEDVLTIIHDHYKSLDNELYKLFMKLYNNRYKSIKFSDEIESYFSNYSDGYCMYINILDKNYINISDCDGVAKLINTAHEIGHAVSYFYNPSFALNKNDIFLSEIASLFFELIITNDVASIIDSYDASLNNIITLEEYYRYSKLLSLHNNLVNVWLNNNGKVDNKFYQNIKNKYKLTRNIVKESISLRIDIDGVYSIDYMLALSLLNIYKKDKEKAIYILKQIINSSNDSFYTINKYMPNISNFKEEVNNICQNYSKQLNKILIK